MNKILVSGKVEGIILKSNDPINFLGTVDKKLELLVIKNTLFLKKQLKIPFLYFHQVLAVVWVHILSIL